MSGRALHAGYDVKTPDPGTVESMACDTCGAEMDVERDVLGATGFAQAMSGGKSRFDRFTCPHAGKDWHEQLIRLMEEERRLASPSLKAVVRKDIEDLKRRNATR